jgi:hypothetical protein
MTTSALALSAHLSDLLTAQNAAILLVRGREVAAFSVNDPEGQRELDTLREIFAENLKKIDRLLKEQVCIVENLLELEEESSEQDAARLLEVMRRHLSVPETPQGN